MIWAIVAWLPGFFPPLMIITIPFQLYCVYRLARALKLGIVPIAGSMILIFVPFICLLVLLAVNLKAMAVLRAAGIPVGLLGARVSDLPHEKPQ